MGALLVNVPDEREADFHVMFGSWLAADGASAVQTESEAEAEGTWVQESGLSKRLWEGVDSSKPASWLLGSIDSKIHPLIKLFLDDPEQKRPMDVLVEATGWQKPTVMAYRRLLGKQAWRAGKYVNPITSAWQGGQRVYYMRPVAADAFKAAMG